jgi:hypothetical protein
MLPCQEDTSRTTTMLAKKMMKASIQCANEAPRQLGPPQALTQKLGSSAPNTCTRE